MQHTGTVTSLASYCSYALVDRGSQLGLAGFAPSHFFESDLLDWHARAHLFKGDAHFCHNLKASL